MSTARKMVSRRDFLRLGGAGLAAAALLGAEGCGLSGDEKTTGSTELLDTSIGWQAIPSYSTLQNPDKDRARYLRKAIDRWQENRKFTVEPVVASGGAEAMDWLLERASRGQAPDIAQIDSHLFPRFYEHVHPLDDYLDDGFIEDFFPFARGIMTGGESVKGLQFTTDIRVMYYRKDLIPDPPLSWNKLLDMAPDLKEEVRYPFLFPAGRDEVTMTTTLLPLFWGQGGELVDEDSNPAFLDGGNRDAMFNALDFIQECVETEATPRKVAGFVRETDLNGYVASGRTALFLGSNRQVRRLKELVGAERFTSRWGIAPIPSLEGNTVHATTTDGWVWGVFTNNGEKLRAGLDFLRTAFVGERGMAGWCNLGDYLPTRSSVFDDPAYEGNEYTDVLKVHLEMFARTRPSAETYPQISGALQTAVTRVVSGEASPKEALQAAVDSLSRPSGKDQ